ncbi:hypothetical protein [Asticcacaulis endophyticus]|uniref:Uncharacterized protein n=1 Tax=Asticcacaulis endophyticus TaxID=1395890 RepID=A0A918Q4F2_9CAUL|nr:hypothetical protein [Asticcacaulis endophyticus]GGZ30473.1 hypothetical protein GCM10011273_15950 [Asticcacaulis endophyticus]
MKPTEKPLSFDDATFPPRFETEASVDVQAWQAEKIAAGIKAADEGRFATAEDIRAVIQKFVTNG